MVQEDEGFHKNLQQQKEACREFTDVVKFEVQSDADNTESEENSLPGPMWHRVTRNSTDSNQNRVKCFPFEKSNVKCSPKPSNYICFDTKVCLIPSDSLINEENNDIFNSNTEYIELTETVSEIIAFLKSKFDELNDIYEEYTSETNIINQSDLTTIFEPNSLQAESTVIRLSSGKSSGEWKIVQDLLLDAKFCNGSRIQSESYPCDGCERACCANRIANKKWFWIPEKKDDKPCCDEQTDCDAFKEPECPKAKYKCILKKFRKEMKKINILLDRIEANKCRPIPQEDSIKYCFENDIPVQYNFEEIKSALENSQTKLRKLSKMLETKSLSKLCDDCCSAIPPPQPIIKKHYECTAGKCEGNCRYMLLHSPAVYRPTVCDETKSEPQNGTLKKTYECASKKGNANCKCKKQCTKKPKMKYEVSCNSIKKLCYSEKLSRRKYGIGKGVSNQCPKIFETVGDLIYAADECKEKFLKERSKKSQRKRLQLEKDKLIKCDRLELKCIKTCGGKCERDCLNEKEETEKNEKQKK